jgi:hypothetical protein
LGKATLTGPISKTIQNAIKNVGVSNIKKIVELRKDLVEAKYLPKYLIN